MAFDKVIDSAALDAGMVATANAIREKTGQAGAIPWENDKGFSAAVAGIQVGGGSGGGETAGGGMGAVKFVDEDITIAESTSTAVSYTIDGVAMPTLATNPNKWITYTGNEVYICLIKAKEVEGEYAKADKATSSAMLVLFGHTNYGNHVVYLGGSYGADGGSIKPNTQCGFCGASIGVTSAVNDGVPYASVGIKVRTVSGYFVPAGVYNVQFWMLTDFNWGM